MYSDRIERNPFFISVGFLLFAVLAEYLAIIILNNGIFVYTLDDPYIHMALSENILNGHYGVNNNEYSSPSSSILWPYLISPFSSYEYFPFIVNIGASIAAIYLFIRILIISIKLTDNRLNNILISFFGILLIILTNMIGLIFTGMEHSLQVLFVVLIAYGLILEVEENKVNSWLVFAIVVAPLIRYENLAISASAIIYLIIQKQYKISIIASALIIILIGSFSAYLSYLGLDIFPTSVTAKSSIVESGGGINSIASNIAKNLTYRQGIFLLLGMAILLSYHSIMEDEKKKKLALIAIIASFVHLIAGRFGWYHRYEIYIWSFDLLVIFYIYGEQISKFFDSVAMQGKMANTLFISIIITLIIGMEYITDLFTVPVASNNIYEQQYQMHRFVTEYYKQPIAVNDLGYVSYKNDNYVLDLWGLASKKALQLRKHKFSNDWIRRLVDEKNVSLAMIYKEWFTNIPDTWKEIGVLQLGKERITPAYSQVTFYSINPYDYPDINIKMRDFVKTLPDDVTFTFTEK